MPDDTFDPDAFLAEEGSADAFDPDEFLGTKPSVSVERGALQQVSGPVATGPRRHMGVPRAQPTARDTAWSPEDAAARHISAGVTHLQEGGKYSARELLGKEFWSGGVVEPVSGMAGQLMKNSPGARLLGFRAAQGTTPFWQGDAVENYVQNLPEAQEGARDLERGLPESVAPTIAATAQFGGQMLGSTATELGPMLKGLVASGQMTAKAAGHIASAMAKGAATNHLMNAAQAPLGAEEGHRAQAFQDALLPTSPEGYAMAAVGAAGGAMGHLGESRRPVPVHQDPVTHVDPSMAGAPLTEQYHSEADPITIQDQQRQPGGATRPDRPAAQPPPMPADAFAHEAPAFNPDAFLADEDPFELAGHEEARYEIEQNAGAPSRTLLRNDPVLDVHEASLGLRNVDNSEAHPMLAEHDAREAALQQQLMEQRRLKRGGKPVSVDPALQAEAAARIAESPQAVIGTPNAKGDTSAGILPKTPKQIETANRAALVAVHDVDAPWNPDYGDTRLNQRPAGPTDDTMMQGIADVAKREGVSVEQVAQRGGGGPARGGWKAALQAEEAAHAEPKTQAGEPPKSPADEPILPPPQRGEEVYYGRPDGKETLHGSVQKVLPNGDMIIKPASGSPALVRVKAKSVHAVNAVARLPELVPPAPEPVGPITPGQVPPHVQAALEKGVALAKHLANRTPEQESLKILNAVLPTHERYAGPLNEKLLRGKSAARAIPVERYTDMVRKTLPPAERALYSKADLDLKNVARGRMSMQQFALKHPEIGAKAAGRVREILELIDRNDKELQARGVIDPSLGALRDSGAVERYVAKSYRTYTLPPGEWAKMLPDQAWYDAAKLIREENLLEGTPLNTSKLAAELMDIVRSPDPLAALQAAPFFQTKRTKGWIARKQFPKEISALLGEETSGTLAIAHTLAAQENLLNGVRFWDGVVADSRFGGDGIGANPYWSPGPTDVHTAPVPNLPQFGKAKNGFVTPELAELLGGKGMATAGHGFVQAALGHFKSMVTVFGGARSWVNNSMRNVPLSVLVGGLDPNRPIESGKSFGQALRLLLDWKDSPVPLGDLAVVKEAMDAGVSLQGFMGTEAATDSARRVQRALKAALQKAGPNADVWDLMGKVREHVVDPLAKGKDQAGAYYDLLGDSWFKFANYLSLVKKYTAQGMPRVDAVRQASQRINRYMANFEHVAPAVDKARKSGFGVLAPFLSSMAEETRGAINFARDLPKDRETRINAAKLGLMGAGVAVALKAAQRMNNISQDDIDQADTYETQRSQGWRPVKAYLPIRDGEGRLQSLDMTSWAPFGWLFRGDVRNGRGVNIAFNALTAPLQGGSGGDFAQDMAEQTGEYHGEMDPMLPPRTGEGGGMKVLEALMNRGALPGGARSLYNDIRSMNNQSPSAVPPTGGQVAARAAGIPLVPAPGNAIPALTEAQIEIDKLQKEMGALKYNANLAGDPERMMQVASEKAKRLLELRARVQQIQAAQGRQ